MVFAGVRHRHARSYEYSDVRTVQVHQSKSDRMLRRGVVVLGVDAEDVVLRRVRRPDAFARVVDHVRQRVVSEQPLTWRVSWARSRSTRTSTSTTHRCAGGTFSVTAARDEPRGRLVTPVTVTAVGARYRCNDCGNLTRFDVVETTTVRSFHHYSLGGISPSRNRRFSRTPSTRSRAGGAVTVGRSRCWRPERSDGVPAILRRVAASPGAADVGACSTRWGRGRHRRRSRSPRCWSPSSRPATAAGPSTSTTSVNSLVSR